MNGREPLDPASGAPTTASRSTPPAPEGEPPDRQPPAGARAMNTLRWALFAGLLVLAVASVGSYVASRWPRAGVAHEHRQARYYCPMHPSYTSDKPGECPICGMSLEPIPAGGTRDPRTVSGGDGDVPGLSSVHITPERVQLIGVRTAVVEKRPFAGSLDLVGFVAPDETRLKRIQIRAAGWVRELFVNRTGQRVAVGEPLLAMYSPEIYQSEQEYLIELLAHPVDTSTVGSSSGHTHEAESVNAALTRLTLLGVPPAELKRLNQIPVALPELTLRSTVEGTVLERHVTQGQYVAADAPLFTIADLSRVWVLADLYEMDFGSVREGDRVVFAADAMPGREFNGRIEFVDPTVSSETRTLRARLSLANRDGALKPGMYGRVRVAGRGGAFLAVPAEAVVNTGEHQYVFLARAGGHFEPRMVWTSGRDGDWLRVLKGIAAGDTVVASASFLIDSESRLKAAIAGMGRQPQTGHQH